MWSVVEYLLRNPASFFSSLVVMIFVNSLYFDRDNLSKKIPTGPSQNMQLWME